MTWNECKNYGLTVPEANGNGILLFYDQFSYRIATAPAGFYAESGIWQGDFLQVRGKDSHGSPKMILMDGFNSWRFVL